MGRVRIFPARIEDSSVIEHGRAPVVVLVETQLADARAVGIHDVQIGDGVAAAHAGNALETAGGIENNPAVRQITGVVIVHVRLHARCHLSQACAVRCHLPDLPAVVGA